VLPISEAEWVKLAAVLAPDPTEVAAGELANSPRPENSPRIEPNEPRAQTHSSILAERFQRMLKK
jgi:hypothetical protein